MYASFVHTDDESVWDTHTIKIHTLRTMGKISVFFVVGASLAPRWWSTPHCATSIARDRG